VLDGDNACPSVSMNSDKSGSQVSLSSDGTKVAIGAPYNEGVNGSQWVCLMQVMLTKLKRIMVYLNNSQEHMNSCSEFVLVNQLER